MAILHVIYGWPGAGKTTRARELAAHSPAVMFCEDEWLAALVTEPITSVPQYVAASTRIRTVIGPLATRVLELGTSTVFDFAGNTPAHRAWARSIAEAAGAEVCLHVLEVPADECRRRLHERNQSKPAGLYFGEVSDALFDSVVRHIVPPTEDEGLRIIRG